MKYQDSISDILDTEVDEKYTMSDRMWEYHQKRKLEHQIKGNGFKYTLIDENSNYLPTIPTRYYKDGSDALLKQEGKNPRKLTPRELARAFGYRDSFKFPVSDTQAYKQLGNSVAVPVIDKLAHEIKSAIIDNYKVIDLFAGIGGIRLGFQKYFPNCVFSSEWDKFAQQTYHANFGEIPHGDITKIEAQDIPDFDILLAGFPCQAFSIAGLKKGFEDTRGTLFFDILRIIKHHKPKVVFLENVKNLKYHDKGNTYKVICDSLENEGYTIHSKILNARDFGLPQNRERIYIIGFLEKVDFQFPEPTVLKKKTHDLLEKDVEDRYYYTKGKFYNTLLQHVKCPYTVYNRAFGDIRKSESSISPTLLSTMGAGAYNIPIILDKKGIRKLTPRECSRLQGYGDDFIFPVSNSQAYKQIGNSVAISVIENIAKQIYTSLDSI